MREREYGINVRVNQTEKKKLTANARRYGLSLSAYLRKTGLEQTLQPPPTQEFQELYRELFTLQSDLNRLDKATIEVRLDEVQRKLLDLYHGIGA